MSEIPTEIDVLRLPNGLKFYVREGTNDHNTVQASVVEDEYGLADLNVSDSLVFDVGAYLGTVGIWLASRGARVICLEPVPPNAQMIRFNAELNDVADRVTVLEAAAGTDGIQTVRWGFAADPTWDISNEYATSIHHHRFVGNTRVLPPADQVYEELRVPSYSLARMVDAYGTPDVIKLDCEGGEWPWLADPMIAGVDLVVGEWHPWSSSRPEAGVLDQHELERLLSKTHDLVVVGPTAGPGEFRAMRR